MTNTTISDSFEKAYSNQALADEVYHALATLARKDQVIAALNLEAPDSLPEEFWEDALRTVRRRFLAYCMSKLRLDMAAEFKDLTDEDLVAVHSIAEECLAKPDFSYTTIRTWFLNKGQFEFSKAVELRRERNKLSTMCIRVLVLLETGGAKYLAYDPITDTPLLVEQPQAHRFAVSSSSELEKSYLSKMSEHFEALRKLFPVKEIKLLSGQK